MDKTKIKVQAFLARVPLFNSMRPEELDRIALGTTECHVARGETIFQRGDPCVGFHAVVYGQVKLSFVSVNGAEKVIELVGPGHSFGEALMFMGSPYIVSAQAMADSLLLHVAKPTIFREIQNDPGFACKMLAGLSQRMHALMCDLESYSLRSGTQRVSAYLLKEQPGSTEITLPVAKAVLASRLNLTPEHFSRIMSELSGQQLISFKGRRVTILDPDKLRLCAG
ncbi:MULTISPECIES: Crp/Fnr family transcriptional regulator [Telluria group]|uniref:CRP-like cAMP-binding protein n=1 Tax=Pseudoduganella violacea TaxID=1715466 RepID=A0A7W5FVY7_9BURK|nr:MULTISPECIES: Crp/Fnr family transcriptional regulator [Telluria group]AKU20537.1 Crp/Fnr family transcriptional regulator [Massilia sp. NR 4-1]MBB3120698.1 CRP-like cAMP-binding protein [Pseudoduganella violacea]NVD99353.1 Crp/Fnr family transcriptional regulator [Massilia sp. BJB1822]UMR30010.1 Crp/Fnr family transcriptional regulator [Massilia sp. MB5]UTY59012.1 Crp/Fnr family transcriptional regulator [Massilia sp. erpn]